MRAIDELHLECPFLGARQLSKIFAREGHPYAGRLNIGTLIEEMGITALCLGRANLTLDMLPDTILCISVPRRAIGLAETNSFRQLVRWISD